ncbi:eukaryotic translation initiation factor 3 subunit g [Phtheirospermum japonicum]|uniref:Eukaryotic translation initiation factor 3 subunit g n=1 Tax=Phtheirospermum japonicum TaxID=374723 RepID=A0A830C2H6_9LAMI|nr:eukaryotic translation initiation factor 3 subunit g [Phtheirospermum japonicum]
MYEQNRWCFKVNGKRAIWQWQELVQQISAPLRKMREPKSKKAIHVRNEATNFCHIWFIWKGNLILTRCKTSSSREEYKSDTTYTTLGLQSQGGYMSFELCQGGATGSMERVTNLSEDTREPDLHELFRPSGNVSRVYVAIDQKTGTSRGFGFVNFVNREDAEGAINKLNEYGYDNISRIVEWAAPMAN